MGTGLDGIDLKDATAKLRKSSGLDGCKTIRKEGAPIPLRPMDRWDNGQDVVLAGDAAGVVAPSSGEGLIMQWSAAASRQLLLRLVWPQVECET